MAASVFVLGVAIWCSVLVLACSTAVEGRPGCRSGHGMSCLDRTARASPSDMNENIMVSHGEANGRLRPSEPAVGSRSDVARAELRWAPSGPDPLHHNGGSPKKPQTP